MNALTSLLFVLLISETIIIGVLLTIIVERIPRVQNRDAQPTKRQREYAQALGIKLWKGISRGEVSDLLTDHEIAHRRG